MGVTEYIYYDEVIKRIALDLKKKKHVAHVNIHTLVSRADS